MCYSYRERLMAEEARRGRMEEDRGQREKEARKTGKEKQEKPVEERKLVRA